MKKDKFTLRKDTVERMCHAAQMEPAARTKIGGYDIFVADGFSLRPWITYKRFGVDPKDFPFGCYCTIWFVARGEEHFDVGLPMLFDRFHNPELEDKSKRLGRINQALVHAEAFVRRRKKVRSEGASLNA